MGRSRAKHLSTLKNNPQEPSVTRWIPILRVPRSRPGRAFLWRLIDATKNAKQPWQLIRLTKGAREDLHMWQVFLQSFNGRAMIPDQYWALDEDLTTVH